MKMMERFRFFFPQKNSMRLPSRYSLFKMRFEKLYGATDFEFKRGEEDRGCLLETEMTIAGSSAL